MPTTGETGVLMRPDDLDPSSSSTGPCCFECGGASHGRKPGACIPFADPSEDGLNAEVFWHAETFARILKAYARAREDPGFGRILTLRELGIRRTLLKTIHGEQHLLVRDHWHMVQLLCSGVDIRTDPFSIELVIDQFPDVESRLPLLKIMASVYRRRAEGGTGRWTVDAMRHRDALAALDRRSEGFSYREIAVFLYGKEAVRKDWTSPDQTMKNRVVRSVKRGLRMMNGGYRALLT